MNLSRLLGLLIFGICIAPALAMAQVLDCKIAFNFGHPTMVQVPFAPDSSGKSVALYKEKFVSNEAAKGYGQVTASAQEGDQTVRVELRFFDEKLGFVAVTPHVGQNRVRAYLSSALSHLNLNVYSLAADCEIR